MKLAGLFGHIEKKGLINEPSDELPLPKCNVGLEWEFEMGIQLRDFIASKKGNPYLTVHDDGSLRDNGVEIVTAGDGLYGKDVFAAINMLSAAIGSCTQMSPVCNFRTGFHVHVDVRDMEDKELHNLLILYCLLERPIFSFCGKNRWASNFAVPWFRSDVQFGHLKNIEKLSSFDNIGRSAVATSIKGLQRYSALNCQAVAKLGSIEFRHMENDLNELTTKQVDFIRIALRLKKLALECASLGLYGSDLFRYCKDLSPAQLLRRLGMELPTQDWDYGESLMLALGLLNSDAQPEQLDTFFDVAYTSFVGKHPNWR